MLPLLRRRARVEPSIRLSRSPGSSPSLPTPSLARGARTLLRSHLRKCALTERVRASPAGADEARAAASARLACAKQHADTSLDKARGDARRTFDDERGCPARMGTSFERLRRLSGRERRNEPQLGLAARSETSSLSAAARRDLDLSLASLKRTTPSGVAIHTSAPGRTPMPGKPVTLPRERRISSSPQGQASASAGPASAISRRADRRLNGELLPGWRARYGRGRGEQITLSERARRHVRDANRCVALEPPTRHAALSRGDRMRERKRRLFGLR